MKYLNNFWTFLRKFKKFIILLLSLFLFYLLFIYYTDIHQIAIKRNFLTGETSIDTIHGFSISSPWTMVSRIDTRPQRICITSSTRNFNCMLVSFNKDGWEEFIQLEGFYYYWWANRFSFNMGYDDEYRGMKDLIRGYSFDENTRSFIRIEKELID